MSWNILIVDDSAVTRSVLKKTLGMTDIPIDEIYQAANGAKALEVLDEKSIDLILADLNMPVMNGLEMTERIVTNEQTKDIPIIVISTEASTTRIGDLLNKGIKGYIHKPFTPENVRDEILKVTESVRT